MQQDFTLSKMIKNNFITLIIALSFCCVAASFVNGLSSNIQLSIALFFIILLGIPHGAIDHVLFKNSQKKSGLFFYSFYLGMMLLGLFLWGFSAQLAFSLFIILSAFHFGQSQFVSYNFKPFLRNILYFSWGLSLLAGLMHYKSQELSELSLAFPDLALLNELVGIAQLSKVAIITSGITIAIFLYALAVKWWSVESFLLELILLGMLHSTFYLMPFIVGFTIYFTVFHSLSVLNQEYSVLKDTFKGLNTKRFIWMLTPFTVLSIFGLLTLFILSAYGWLPISNYLLMIIFISILTIPHSVVMDAFYKKADKNLI